MNDSDDNKTLLSHGDAVSTEVDGDESYCAACGASYPMDVDVCPKDGARLTKLKARHDELIGRVFDGRFEVRTALGNGGMGTVYRGWQLTTDREIAIKVIHPKLASDRTAVKRFLREARLSSRLSQPNIVNVYDFGQTEDGVVYIAMELLRGHTLGRELEAMRPLSVKRVLGIGQQLCDALDSAHGQGIVHRDLKPNNIVILDDPPGRDLIKVLDFGLAKSLVTDAASLVTNTNAILGTPLYMPPEQIEGKPSDQRADLYSLGCILYQMCSGRPPFLGESVNAVLAAHVDDEPEPLPQSVPPALAKAIARLMQKDPAKRMQSAREAREALQSIVESGLVTSDVSDSAPDVRPGLDETLLELAVTDPAGAVGRPRPTVEKSAERGRPLRWLAPAIVAFAALCGGVMYLVMRDDTDRPAPPPPAPPIVAPAAPDAAELMATPADERRDDAAIAGMVDASEAMPAIDARSKPRVPRTTAKAPVPTPPTPPPPAVMPDADLELFKSDKK